VFSLKPTKNRIANFTYKSTWDTLESTPGPIANSVDDLTLLMDVLVDPKNITDPDVYPLKTRNPIVFNQKLKIGYYVDDEIMRASPTTQRAVSIAVRTLEARGHELVPFKIPDPHQAFILLSKMYNHKKVICIIMKSL
jgi:Asp-tRNA(Asn)/Glu-tRNA(Gln) amidotransferase A subunit family amidase